MADLVFTAEPGGADGADVTTADAYPDAPTVVTPGAGGTIRYEDTAPLGGSKSVVVTPATGVAGYLGWTAAAGQASGLGAAAFRFRVPTLPATGQGILNIRSGGGGTSLLTVALNSNGTLVATSDVSGGADTTTGVVTAGTAYRMSVQLTTVASGSGALVLKVYDAAGSVIPDLGLTLTGKNYGTSNPGTFRFGKTSSAGSLASITVDDLQARTGDNTEIPAVATGPTVVTASDTAAQTEGTSTLTASDTGADAVLVESSATVASTSGGSDALTQSEAAGSSTAAPAGTDPATLAEAVTTSSTTARVDASTLSESAAVSSGDDLAVSDPATLTEGAAALSVTAGGSEVSTLADADGVGQSETRAVVDSSTLTEPAGDLAASQAFGSSDVASMLSDLAEQIDNLGDAEDWAELLEAVSVVKGYDQCPIALVVSLDQVRRWCRVTPTSISDDDLREVVCAEGRMQATACRVPDYSVDGFLYPSPLRQALYRRVARELAARDVPLGLAGLESQSGAYRLPSFDAEIERLEGQYRRWVFA